MQQRIPPSLLQTLTAPVFSLCRLRTESHQTPVGIKLAAMLCDRPGGVCHPRETLVPSRVQGVAHSPYGCRRGDASPQVAHGLGDSAICTASGGAKALSKSLEWLHTSPLSWLTAFGQTVTRNSDSHRRVSARAACGSTLAPTCAPESWSPGCHWPCACLAFIEALGLRAVAPREVRRLYEGPGEVLVAVLGVTFTFLLVVALA